MLFLFGSWHNHNFARNHHVGISLIFLHYAVSPRVKNGNSDRSSIQFRQSILIGHLGGGGIVFHVGQFIYYLLYDASDACYSRALATGR